ncbi:EfeM/EfeO family lipoprotein [Solibacillus merdavium]|uniref:EfeM/EfeO family lipoprotein n=1 Tax=Solibacillus merdavium TaxID=2762218 RepID=A0ABR8XHY6_9BACL|nr:EfeM/EfeO family lipoprotein [Solibacillus merdavium]MBD8031552.1 EfeM/EfeO family lipoprotein [Solibacillus merdavium]
MKNRKKIMFALLAVGLLSACGTKEENPVTEPVEQQEIKIDVADEAEQYKSLVLGQTDSFTADTELLATYVKEGKLEEAQKLYPLVTMYYERMQPLASNFQELDVKINSEVEEGKEAEASGFQSLAHGLFVEKKTAGYEGVADELVENVKALQSELPTMDVSENNVLASAITMFNTMATNRLSAQSISNNEVYAVKAQTEAAEDLLEIFIPRVSTESAETTSEALKELNEIVAYYEVGKEDYVNYSFFTAKQKEELKTAVQRVGSALQEMNDSLK